MVPRELYSYAEHEAGIRCTETAERDLCAAGATPTVLWSGYH